MASPPSRCRQNGGGWTVPIAICLLAAAAILMSARSASAQQIQIRNAAGVPSTIEVDPYGVYLPTDRMLSRGLSRARDRLAEHEYSEALGFLQQVLDRDEDTFLDGSNDAETRRGLKATARELIANLEPAGREMYQLLHAAAARRELEAAMASGDRDELAKLVRQYMTTPSGYEGALLLAQMEFDRGHPLAAAHLYEQLAEDSQAAAQFEPQLSVLAAVGWAAAGEPDRAATTLHELAKRFPGATIEIAGGKRNLPTAGDTDPELLAWLAQSVGVPESAAAAETDWLTGRGDSSRNAKLHGGAPHLSARWQARVVNDPKFETFLSTRRQQFQQHGIVAISAAKPIAVGDVVLMRTPQNVVAVDWHTGKRVWETREEDSSPRDVLQGDAIAAEEKEEPNASSFPLEQRMWDDTLTMSLASDGQHAFALSGMSLPNADENNQLNVGQVMGGIVNTTVSPTNRLTAYELATEGKLSWEIDGANAANELAGAFFLGPPLAVDDTLYVLAEIRSAVYLLALEPRTGRLEWRQQLVGLEQGLMLDPQRQLNAATPSQSAGILVCPTSAGIVVAVDLIAREFSWVYRYPRRLESVATNRQLLQGRGEEQIARDNNRWLDGSVILADGKVFLTPPESNELHCLDLATGKLLWKHPRDNALFVACVDHGKVMLVGPQSLTAINAANNTNGWKTERLDLPEGVQPSGLGYLSQGRYFLPLTSGQVASIDIDKGVFTGSVDPRTEATLGNLICQRGTILSQSALFLDKYEQMDVLRNRAEAALAKDPRDATAIRDLAEMRHLEGALPEAVKMLKQAYDIDSTDPLTRDMLANCLLEALAVDYPAYHPDLPLLQKIVRRPQQEIELLRLEAQGMQTAGQRMEAFAAYLRLADATAADPVSLAIGTGQSVRSDCWIRARLNELWTAATADEKSEIERQTLARRKSWPDSPSDTQLRRYLAQFGGLPGTDEVRLQLIHMLIDRRELLDTEMELLKLDRSQNNESRATAALLMIKWLLADDRTDEARRFAASFSENWSAIPAIDGKTPQQWFAEWRLDAAGDRDLSERDWPRGQVTAEISPATAAARGEATRRAQAEFPTKLAKLRVEQVYRPGLGPAQWMVATDNTRLVGRNGAGRDVFHWSTEQNSPMRRAGGNGDRVQAAQLGDLLFVSMSGQILALDSRQLRDDDNDSEAVWQAFPGGRFPVIAPRTGRRAAPTLYHTTWSERKRLPAPAGMAVGGLGPVSPYGVVLQEQQQLRLADPTSGETLWSRSDIPTGCELFGDDEVVLAASIDDGTVYVISMADGRILDRRPLPTTPWLLTTGRNVCTVTDTQVDHVPKTTLRIVDVVSGKELFNADYNPGVRMTTLEPNWVAVASPPDRSQMSQSIALAIMGLPAVGETPPGRFQLIDVATGKARVDQALAVPSVLRSVHTLLSGDQLFVCMNADLPTQSSRRVGPDYPLVDGQVYAFDLATGRPNWSGPAIVQRRGIALTQPDDIPLLVFVDRVMKRDGSGAGSQLRLMCIDKRTGATVYRSDELPDTAGGQFRVRVPRGQPRSIALEMSSQTVRLAFSDRPRPPEPPANDIVEAPRKSLGRGLWGVTQRMGDMLQGAMQDPSGKKWRGNRQGGNDDDNDQQQADGDQ